MQETEKLVFRTLTHRDKYITVAQSAPLLRNFTAGAQCPGVDLAGAVLPQFALVGNRCGVNSIS